VKSRARYRVLAPLFGASVGDILTAQDLRGCNIAALVEGGHLAVVTDTHTTKKEPRDGA
jgi:hypothetical protein